jgi:peptidylprolyl isomerase
MAIARGLLLLLSAALLTGCVHTPEAPQCTATPFDVASVSGDTVTTTTGLRYIEGLPGSGAALPWCRAVIVHYTGYLLDGTKFDSSRDIDRPLLFTPGYGDVIAGFEQGVISMRTCGTRRIVVPPGLGYGAEPRRDQTGQIIVPANSTLVYDIEVLEIAGESLVSCDTV